jgi:hypothetical protein
MDARMARPLFVTAQANTHVRFRRAMERRALWMAEDAARELPNRTRSNSSIRTPRGSRKYERAAMRWLERYLAEGSPRLQRFAAVTTELASREPES